MENKRRRINIDGNAAAAYVAHATNEVIAIYPITPSSVMGEICDEKSARGETNIWGVVPAVTALQSESGAAGAVHGSLSAGSLTTTFTASQGLLLMIPNMYKIAGECTPTVFHVSARALAAQALSIFGDHSDVMACRAAGWIMMVSANPQEVMDMALISQAVTLRARLPVLHFFDGFRTSHEMAMAEELTYDDMRCMIDNELIRAHRSRALSPDHPSIKGTSQNPDVYFQGRESANQLYAEATRIAQEEMDKFAGLTGRQYHNIEYYGATDAEDIIVVMGSAADVTEETIDTLNKHGGKYGLIKIRLFIPFPSETFVKTLPAGVKRIAVLDRTKEPGNAGEPLYQLVRTALGEAAENNLIKGAYPSVTGGRFGLGSKDFTPAMVKAVYDNLRSEMPVKSFTVGITDDITGKSLSWDANWITDQENMFNAMFYGLGSDGTVGANKNTAKIIYNETTKNVQAYFVYDSKKSGSMTTSHLRIGDRKIKSSYLIQKADFIACHHFSFLEHFNILGPLKKGGTFLLNSQCNTEDVWGKLPEFVRRQITAAQARFYTIDAVSIAEKLGLGSRVNMALQAAFFKISGIIGEDTAKKAIAGTVIKTYGRYGEKTVEMNIKAMEHGFNDIELIKYPGFTEKSGMHGDAGQIPFVIKNRCTETKEAPDFVRNTISMLTANEGDKVKVSQMPVDGTWPVSTARYEKRNIAINIPVWNETICTQCAMCSFLCPHAAIRLKIYDEALLKNAPATFKSADAKGKEFAGMKATMQVAPEDCTGCGVCVFNCPVSGSDNASEKAINMRQQMPLRGQEAENFAFFRSIPELPVDKYSKTTLKGVQLAPHHFEFSGACAGCGETPYIKLLTQLFGDRLIIANATGCSSIFGGNLPTTPYCTRADGRGPAWANSLFEDNAEFGLGISVAAEQQADYAKHLLAKIAPLLNNPITDMVMSANPKTQSEIEEHRKNIETLKAASVWLNTQEAADFLAVADQLVKKSVWIVGGDGWAYDIGYGGLDHVIAGGADVNLLVLDTEVYSNTGGQSSKSTPMAANAKFASKGKMLEKKDLGMIAMTYGRVYVAHISLSNAAQCIKAFSEAESFPGPSLIIAYSHCIAHGINMTKGIEEHKKAIRTGYWPLYRFDPRLMIEGKTPLQMDSKTISGSLADFMDGENRFRITKKATPELYEKLSEEADKNLKRRINVLKQIAEKIDFS
ncbi:MAG: pyruvate:ferredoxin (flavodoxin) oxidoreductase [Deferribacteraceae bacterium]|jgi:pyruvate-ferredoxin/flavodoxin oxidoreductase|nr:pyruvate:ferredoxin (flavodoxin) oxidoreductase [Deferribacteraceae bacterium]